MKKHLESLLFRFISNLAGLKCQMLIFICVMFCMGKVTESSWKELVIVLLGFRAASDVAGIVKGKDNDS